MNKFNVGTQNEKKVIKHLNSLKFELNIHLILTFKKTQYENCSVFEILILKNPISCLLENSYRSYPPISVEVVFVQFLQAFKYHMTLPKL